MYDASIYFRAMCSGSIILYYCKLVETTITIISLCAKEAVRFCWLPCSHQILHVRLVNIFNSVNVEKTNAILK